MPYFIKLKSKLLTNQKESYIDYFNVIELI